MRSPRGNIEREGARQSLGVHSGGGEGSGKVTAKETEKEQADR